MEGKLSAEARDDFHSMNNLLNKITAQAGMLKYHLEVKGIDPEKIEEERDRLIKAMVAMEESALKVGEILKKLRKVLSAYE